MEQNPYSDPNSLATSRFRWMPTIISACITLISIPICFFGWLFFESYANSHINNAGVIGYLFIIAVLALPFTGINSLVVAPQFEKLTKSNSSKANGIVAILFLIAIWILLVLTFPSIATVAMPDNHGWLMYYYIMSFLGLPAILGIFVYMALRWFADPDPQIGG